MSDSGAHVVDEDKNQDRELHFTFVELLFSLAVAEIAQRFAVVIDKAEGNFLETKYWPCYSNGTGLRRGAQLVAQAKHDGSICGSSIVAEHLECRAIG